MLDRGLGMAGHDVDQCLADDKELRARMHGAPSPLASNRCSDSIAAPDAARVGVRSMAVGVAVVM